MRSVSEEKTMSMPAIRLVLEDTPNIALQTQESREAADDALRSAMARFERPLIGYAQGLLGEWEMARDVVQDTFVKLHRALKTQEPESLKAWLFTVCRNRALDILRRAKRMTSTDTEILEAITDDAQPNPAKLAERKDSHDRVMKFVGRLTENQQEVIRLKFQADLSYKEISEVTGLSSGNVGYLLHHALKRLRELMQDPATA
ncbi:MAG: RNA polymerase sigma factor (sigma-70 family) [Verrucomicrobiales bacterium]|jgi:RNA polymerase sigma factor (sigma-70 family)